MSLRSRYVVDTPHGRFTTASRDGRHALIFRNRDPNASVDVIWVRTTALLDHQKQRLTRLGFQILGSYAATACVDTYLARPAAS